MSTFFGRIIAGIIVAVGAIGGFLGINQGPESGLMLPIADRPILAEEGDRMRDSSITGPRPSAIAADKPVADEPAVTSAPPKDTSSTATVTTANAPKALTSAQLLALADDTYADGNVPLGDNKYTTTAAQKGYIYLCNTRPAGGGAAVTGPWVGSTSWNFQNKAMVDGANSWSNATFSSGISGAMRVLTGNGLPTNHTTGTFPVAASDDAYQYDRNPNTISANTIMLSLPTEPTYSETPYCMPTGEVGVMLNGVRLFNGMDAAYRDAPAHEVQDHCDGHPQASGQYHYHSLSSCVEDSVRTVIGYANDGFPITGPVVAEGKYLTTEDLDVCHGITSEVTDENGKTYTTYHYVMTYDYPYSVSCYRGEPAVTAPSGAPQQQTMQQGGTPSGASAQGSGNPPQEAIAACSGKYQNTNCSFSTPQGTISGVCRTPPNSTSLACVPQ